MAGNLPKPTGSSVLGQLRDDAFEQVADAAGDTAKAVVNEPKKILESILGSSKPNTGGVEDSSIETMSQAGDDPAAKQAAMQKLAQKQQDDQQKSQALVRLHQQRLQEERDYFMKQKQEDEQKKQQDEQQDQAQKQHEIVQLQHEKAKSDQLQGPAAQAQGSKESKAWGAG